MTFDDLPRLVSQGVHLEILDNTDSTNRYLAENPGPANAWSVVVTDNQSSGRGRAGRQWLSPPGRGLAISMQLPESLVPHPIHQGWLGWLSLIVGAALADAIARMSIARVSVKWPNDVWVDGKKVAGILGEITPDSRVVVGMGVNLFYGEHELPTPESTSLGLHGTLPPDVADQLVSDVLDTLMRVIPRVVGPVPGDIREWVELRLDTLHQTVRITTPTGENLVGEACGLADDGSLLVRLRGSQRVEAVSVGDIDHLRHE